MCPLPCGPVLLVTETRCCGALVSLPCTPPPLAAFSSPTPSRSPSLPGAGAQVAKHATARDCWLVISGGVYDVTAYLSEHPGGEDVVLDMAGTCVVMGGGCRDARSAVAPLRHRCAPPPQPGVCFWGGGRDLPCPRRGVPDRTGGPRIKPRRTAVPAFRRLAPPAPPPFSRAVLSADVLPLDGDGRVSHWLVVPLPRSRLSPRFHSPLPSPSSALFPPLPRSPPPPSPPPMDRKGRHQRV